MPSLFVTHSPESDFQIQARCWIPLEGSTARRCVRSLFPVSKNGWVIPTTPSSKCYFKYGDIVDSGFVFVFENRAALSQAKRLQLVPPTWTFFECYAVDVKAYYNSIGQLPSELICRAAFVPAFCSSGLTSVKVESFLKSKPNKKNLLERIPSLKKAFPSTLSDSL
jgi:hypothetical protein